MTPIHTILHATDFSPEAAYAFELASGFARDHGARLVVVHVMRPARLDEADVNPVSATDPADARRELRKRLMAVRPAEDTVAAAHCLRNGDPATEIVRLAEECHPDLIVMGTHGRRGMERLLLGSVAADVMRKAPCPVLAVRVPAGTKAPLPTGQGLVDQPQGFAHGGTDGQAVGAEVAAVAELAQFGGGHRGRGREGRS